MQIAAPHRTLLLQGLACVVMAGVMLQTSVSPGQRIVARAHIHLAAVPSQPISESDASPRQIDHPAETPHGALHAHPHAHGHSHAETHEHGSDRNDVVYVATQDSDLPAAQAPHRLALDLDWLLLQALPSSVDLPVQMALAVLALSFRSRVVPPPERPPRADA